jgi:hypothetical protein
MTEEEARPENTQPGASPPYGQPEGQKSLTDRNSDILTGSLRFQQPKEQDKMETAVATAGETKLSPSAQDAIKQFKEIKEALAGAKPEWSLPDVDKKAVASSPKLVNP